MMWRNFQEIEDSLGQQGERKVIALAGSHDEDALRSVAEARRRGIADAVLIGRIQETAELLKKMDEPEEAYRLVECDEDGKAAALACSMVKEGKADLPMKGLMHTAVFLKEILNKENGFVGEKSCIAQATVLDYKKENRLLIISDCAINIEPTYEEKKQILINAVELARQLGCHCPRVAVVAAVEVVNPKMRATVEAAMLSKACERGQLPHCIVDGPLALDNAISAEAALHKGIRSQVSGQADVLIMPDLAAGNLFTKSLTYFAGLESSGNVTGTKRPVIMTSRSDTAANKYHSILIAVAQAVFHSRRQAQG